MLKVLLVNDSKFETMVITDILKTLRYEVKVSNESDVFDDIKYLHPDFVIINYIMKSLRGDQLIARIKLQNPYVKCILSSSNPIQLEDFKMNKVDSVFQTPVNKDTLKRILIQEEEGFKKENRIMLMCPHCNKELDALNLEYNFCPFCGNKFRA